MCDKEMRRFETYRKKRLKKSYKKSLKILLEEFKNRPAEELVESLHILKAVVMPETPDDKMLKAARKYFPQLSDTDLRKIYLIMQGHSLQIL